MSGAGSLSGTKTDMAVNVYEPGCHLLCHDDVIGSRRVSYILYLTDPETPWKESWGGALRLYPTKEKITSDGKKLKIPHYEWSKSIPPAWNQLSFFAVQPGESFHDVEEVYKREPSVKEDDGGRVRMAISGWFHIPQEGEEGYEPGLEEKLAERSSLQQLQGKNDAFDLPQPQWRGYDDHKAEHKDVEDDEEGDLTEQDLEFLLKFLTPHYLTPETVEELSDLFAEESSLQLANILSKKFSAKLHAEITSKDQATGKESKQWQVATPPHKHRYMFQQPKGKTGKKQKAKANGAAEEGAHDALLNDFLPSLAFKKWLSLATGLTLGRRNILARRFRKALDYTLATAHEDDDAELEFCLNVTPSKGWGADEQVEDKEETDSTKPAKADSNGDTKANGKTNGEHKEEEPDNIGGYELYMAGDDDDDDDDDGSDHGVEIPSGASNPSATGAGNRRPAKQKKADPAIYQASANDEDDGILFSNPASWNTMSVVLRDKGTLKFVKYVSKAAQGDRWDLVGSMEVLDDDDDDDDENDEEGEDKDGKKASEKEHADDAEVEEEWNGFSD